jgi:predicted dehydrogenase
MGKLLTAILIGAGNRGNQYTKLMAKMEDKFKVIAVAEPIESRRNLVKERHGIPEDMCFADWKPLLEKGKIADVAVIATMDQEHLEPTIAAIDCLYDILLEKPVSPDPIECQKIALAAEKKGVKIVVCHVLRYTPFFITIKNLIDEGRLGKVMSINHEECVGNIHQSHSFVRGNWGNSERSSCMLLQKSCHDMDILQWLVGKKLKKVQSFGNLTYFRKENAPDGSPEYCIEGCPKADTCPYNAVKLYLDDKENGWFRTTSTKHTNPTDEMVENALRTTQYGKCVFKCDNDVVDHQTVNMLFEDDVTITFTMNAFNKGGRFIHIMGTKGELRASMADGNSPMLLYDFETKKTEEIKAIGKDGLVYGHGGGDSGIVSTLYEHLNGEYTGCSVSDIRTSVDNHLIVFAAEESRANNTVVDFEEFVARLTKEC